jgi:ABC-type amino acid transport substrate-binding protein
VIQNYADFKALLTTVGAGGVDMAASGITMSGPDGAGRNATMSFSTSYYAANQAVLAKSASTLTCANSTCGANDLKTLIVGVQSGTTSESWVDTHLKPLMANPSAQIKRFTAVDTELAALNAGSIDIVIIDVGPAKALARASSGSLKVVGQIITGELYGFAVQKGDPQALLVIINSVLAQARANGTYQQLLTKWSL